MTKKLLNVLLVSSLLLFILYSCKKDEESKPNPARLKTNTIVIQNKTYQFQTQKYSKSQDTWNLYAIDSLSNVLDITIFDYKGPGKYKIDLYGVNAAIEFYDLEKDKEYYSANGEVKIMEENATTTVLFSGSFNNYNDNKTVGRGAGNIQCKP